MYLVDAHSQVVWRWSTSSECNCPYGGICTHCLFSFYLLYIRFCFLICFKLSFSFRNNLCVWLISNTSLFLLCFDFFKTVAREFTIDIFNILSSVFKQCCDAAHGGGNIDGGMPLLSPPIPDASPLTNISFLCVGLNRYSIGNWIACTPASHINIKLYQRESVMLLTPHLV